MTAESQEEHGLERVVHRGVTIHRHRKRWRFQLRIDGRRQTISRATFAEARQVLDDILDRRAVEEASSAASRLGSVTIGDLCREWLVRQTHLAPATRNGYEIHLRVHITPKIGTLDANLLRPLELEDFYRGLTYETAQKCHSVLRGSFNWAIRNERLSRPSNPTHHVRPSRRMCSDHDGLYGDEQHVLPVSEKQVPLLEEITLLMKDAVRRGQRWWWLYLVIATTTGARPGENCSLRRRDFDFDNHTLRFEWNADKVSKRVKRPKTAWSVRTLHLPAAFFARVAPYLPEDPDAYLFPSAERRGRQGGSELPCKNSRSIERKLDRQLTRLGLPHYTPHGFRHYVATHLLDQGKQPLQVGKFLGHRDDQMVRKLYGAHIVEDTQRSIGEAASNLVTQIDFE